MSGEFCSQCQERPEEGPCPLHGAEPTCRHLELPDTIWPRLRKAEGAAAYRLDLLRSVTAFVDANNGDLPLTLLEAIRAEAQR